MKESFCFCHLVWFVGTSICAGPAPWGVESCGKNWECIKPRWCVLRACLQGNIWKWSEITTLVLECTGSGSLLLCKQHCHKSYNRRKPMNKLNDYNSILLHATCGVFSFIFAYHCWSLSLTMTSCSASVQDMRNLRFAHKQMEDTLRKSIFEVLMKFAFPVSNGLVSDCQPHCARHSSSALCTDWSVSLPLSVANICLWIWTSLSWKWMEGVWRCIGIQKTGIWKWHGPTAWLDDKEGLLHGLLVCVFF